MKIMASIIHVLARVIAVLMAVFLSLFILEGFGPDFGWQASVGHAIPAAIAVALAVVAFRKPKLGGWLFLSFALLFYGIIVMTSAMTREGGEVPWIIAINPVFLLIAAIGILFLLDAKLNKKR